jgi:twitching motility two-component system response regulator PilG
MRLDIESPSVSEVPASVNGRAGNMSSSEKARTLLENGIAAAQKGDRRSARLLLDLAVEADPDLVDAWLWLASISDYPEELLTYLEKVLELDPENQKAGEWKRSTLALMAKTLVQRAIEAHESNDPKAAVELLDQAIEKDEACTLAWSWKAKLCDDDDEKLKLLHRVLELDPNNTDAAAAIEKIEQEKLIEKHKTARRSIAAGEIGKALECFAELGDSDKYRIEALLAIGFFSDSVERKLAAFRDAAELLGPGSVATLAIDVLQHLTDADADVFSPSAPAGHDSDCPETESECREPEKDDELGRSASFENTLEMKSSGVRSEDEFDPYSTIAPRPEEVSEEFSEAGPDPEDERIRLIANADTGDYRVEISEPPETHTGTAGPEIKSERIIISANKTSASSADKHVCPFCNAENEGSEFECSACKAVLGLSDIDMILSHREKDRTSISNAVVALEAEWNLRELSVEELKTLGIGHLNLGNTSQGLKYLEEACHMDPNDVILVGQTRSIAIRVNEIGQVSDHYDPAMTGKTILVIDDSATIRKLISAKLEKSGHYVVTAEDGEEGLAKLSEKTPDLVLLDITMPKMDGYEVCKQIRANPLTKDVPVVMISGKDGFFDKVRGRMSGATGYVTKPFGPETLMKALDTYLVSDETAGN